MSDVAPCVRCGHGADEHLLQGVGISGEPTTANVETADLIRGDVPRALIGPFLCTADGCACPDYVDELLVRKGKK